MALPDQELGPWVTWALRLVRVEYTQFGHALARLRRQNQAYPYSARLIPDTSGKISTQSFPTSAPLPVKGGKKNDLSKIKYRN